MSLHKPKPTEDEFEKWLEKVNGVGSDPKVCAYCIPKILEKYRSLRPKPTAINGHGVISCPHCFKPVLNDVKPTPVPDNTALEELGLIKHIRDTAFDFMEGRDEPEFTAFSDIYAYACKYLARYYKQGK